MTLKTNAPAGWPRPETADWPGVLRALNDRTRGLAVEVLKPAFPSREGVLYADARVRDPSGRYAVFFFDRPGAAAARRFFAATSYLLAHFPDLESVYYAPEALEPTPHTPEDAGLDQGFVLRPVPRARPGRYPIWRTEDAGRRFQWTPLWPLIGQYMQFLAGREWVGLGLVLAGLGLASSWKEAEEVKDRVLFIPLETPNNEAALISYRPDRGLRLHLHEALSEEAYYPWWDWFFGYLKRHWPADAPAPARSSPPLRWWKELGRRLEDTQAAMVAAVRREAP